MRLLKLSSTRWLAFHMATRRVNLLWAALVKYFLTLEPTNEDSSTVGRIQERLEDPITRLYLLLVEHQTGTLFEFNKKFQLEASLVHRVHVYMAGRCHWRKDSHQLCLAGCV